MSVGASLASAGPRSRLGPPRLPADLLSRPRLLRRLDEWTGMLGGVAAPPGFGKTTALAGGTRMLCVVAAPAGFGRRRLLAEWTAKTRLGRLAWLSIAEGDAEPCVFWAR